MILADILKSKARVLLLLFLVASLHTASVFAQTSNQHDSDLSDTTARHRVLPLLHQHHPLSIQTNTLSWFFAIPSIGLEYAFAPQWSLQGSYYHTWLSNHRQHRYWRYYGGEAELRYWITRQQELAPLQGHHVGAFARIYTYDSKLGEVGILAKRPQWSVGIAYGYSINIGRSFSIDWVIGIGYTKETKERYRYCTTGDCYTWQESIETNYFGPAKVAFTLSYLLP